MRPSARPRIRLAVTAALASSVVLTALTGVGGASVSTSGSQNMRLVGRVNVPNAMGIAFSPAEPLAFVLTRHNGGELVSLDVTDPRQPRVLGKLSIGPQIYLEDLDLGVRADGTTFVLTRQAGDYTQSTVQVVDVTDPREMRVRGKTSVGAHTWTCVDAPCTYAYGSAGGDVPVLDLNDLDNPRLARMVTSPVGGTHDLNVDPAGIVWLSAGNGIAAFDASDPLNPVLLNTSDKHGVWSPTNPYNDRIQLHGSQRPNPHRFKADRTKEDATTFNGSVLLESEEGNDQDCTDSFQTWLIPHLSDTRLNAESSGSITPLDAWSLADDTTPGVERPPATPGWCSVHWFDYHPAGFVVVPTYYQGTHVLDVRNPRAIELAAYHWTLVNAASQSYWVPDRDANGRMNGHRTNLIYTADMGDEETSPFVGIANRGTGGIDIFEVTLPR
jgi:hypothetical protein